MTSDMWMQPSLFPEFAPELFAYEMDWFGASNTSWEVYENHVAAPVAIIESEFFGDFLDTALTLGYDVRINTIASWEALADS